MALRKIAVLDGRRIDITGAEIQEERSCDICDEILANREHIILDGAVALAGRPSKAIMLEMHQSCLQSLPFQISVLLKLDPPF